MGPKLMVVDMNMKDEERAEPYNGIEVINFIRNTLMKNGLVPKKIKIIVCSGTIKDDALEDMRGV